MVFYNQFSKSNLFYDDCKRLRPKYQVIILGFGL